MAFDEGLAQRIREHLGEPPDLVEKRMFGGLCFMLSGAMAVGIVGEELMVRLPVSDEAEALLRPGARPMDFTGRRMKGFLYVSAAGIAADEALGDWLDRAAAHARSLPKKPDKAPAKPRARRGPQGKGESSVG